jgi:multidrug transporter EmrE-like cation transporter
MNFIIGLLYAIAAQILTFIQLQGQFKYQWAKNNPFLMACIGVPLSLLYLGSVKYLVAHFDGQLWPSRLMGFATGAVVFTIMSWSWFREPLTIKTLICLGLALCIMLVQIFWK